MKRTESTFKPSLINMKRKADHLILLFWTWTSHEYHPTWWRLKIPLIQWHVLIPFQAFQPSLLIGNNKEKKFRITCSIIYQIGCSIEKRYNKWSHLLAKQHHTWYNTIWKMFCSSAANLCSHHNMQASADTKNALKQDSVNTLQVKGFCNNTTYPASCLVSESKAADLRARARQSMVPNHSGFCLVHSLQLLHEPIVRHRSDLHTCIYENQSPRGEKANLVEAWKHQEPSCHEKSQSLWLPFHLPFFFLYRNLIYKCL